MITYLTRVLLTTLALSSVSGSILAAGGGGKFSNPDFTQGDTIPALTFADVPIGALTPYESWSSSKNLKSLAAAGDADPDFDGVKNALEFVRGGEPNPATPGSNSVALLPTPTRNLAGDLIFTFRRTNASEAGVSLSFQWTADLAIGSTSSAFDGVQVSITNFDAATRTVVVTVPASNAAGWKLFGRLNAVTP